MDDDGSSDMRPTGPHRWILTALAVAMAGACLWDLATRQKAPVPVATTTSVPEPLPSSPYRNTAAGVAYVGDEVCARCHGEIARAYRQHPMGRSMSVPGESRVQANGVVFQVADLVYSVLRRDGRVLHREERHDDKGRTIAANEEEVRYVLGSGRRGLAFLIEKKDGLYQSPIAWYSQERRWALSPRYETMNLHFDRPITAGCLYCHSNRFDMEEGQPPVFHGLSIGCERCHGPGELHAQRPEAVDGRDWTIVNPADLEPHSLRESVCEQCHLQGSQRLDQPGVTAFDYRPGLPFGRFVRVSQARGDPVAKLQALGHVRLMRESRCYQESAGELGCISCHDPHRMPDPKERVAYYRGRCLECHAERGCALPQAERLAQQPNDDCTACHMPPTNAADVAHTAVTLHSIPRDGRSGR
jgi:hypothetical protein